MRILCLIITLLTIFSCTNSGGEIKDTRSVLGTIATIDIKDKGSKELIDNSFSILSSIENKMSTTIESSDVSKINSANSNSVKVSKETAFVINKALYYGDVSKGIFDITIGELVRLWDISGGSTTIPDSDSISNIIKNINYKDITINGLDVSIKEGMSIDLGGIAKGYAADEVAKYLVENGVSHGIINLGGNIKVIGTKLDNTPYRIGIQDPFSQRNIYLGVVSIRDTSIVSSGDYERFFEVDGVRYHHIFNKLTGFPVVTNVSSVSVITKSSIDGDALSTVFFSLDVNSGFELAKKLGNIKLIYVTKDKNIYISKELENEFELTDSSFTLFVK